MCFKVSKEAEDDLREIGRYTQRVWGVSQRRKYLSEISGKFCFLAENPMVCRERPEFNPPVRIYQYESHLIVYVLSGDGITVVRVLHASMDVGEQKI